MSSKTKDLGLGLRLEKKSWPWSKMLATLFFILKVLIDELTVAKLRQVKYKLLSRVNFYGIFYFFFLQIHGEICVLSAY